MRTAVLLLAPGAVAFTPAFHTATSARALSGAHHRRGRPLAQASIESLSKPKPALANEDEWIGKLDIEGFRDEIR